MVVDGQEVISLLLCAFTGRAMEDGEGSLEDGTRFKRESGETKGKNGYWYRWTKLSGISPLGQVRSMTSL